MQTSAPEARPGQTSGSSLWVVWTLALVLIVYPLSVGPAVKLARAFPAVRPVLEVFYEPLRLLVDHCRPADRFFEWYIVDLWGAK